MDAQVEPRATHSDACRKRLDEAMSNEAKVQNSKRKVNEYVDRRLGKESERIEKDLESKKTKHASEEEKPQARAATGKTTRSRPRPRGPTTR